jgi:5-methylcytosine-specific restriction endonuclease McrA
MLAERAAVAPIAYALRTGNETRASALARQAAKAAYIREYLKVWRKARRLEAIAYLGGECVHCGRKRDLEFDHVDPRTKALPSNRLMTASKAAFWAEIRKCQLLCKRCHIRKSQAEGDYLA